MPSANPTPHPLDAAARLLDAFEEAVRSEERRDQSGANYYAVRPYIERVAEARAALLASVRGAEADTAKVTRFEVIDHRENPGYYRRTFVARPCRVELSYQDDGRTLKVFVDDAAGAHPPTTETDADAK